MIPKETLPHLEWDAVSEPAYPEDIQTTTQETLSCPVPPYRISILACETRRSAHLQDPARHLCDSSCLHLKDPLTGTPPQQPRSCNPRAVVARASTVFLCSGVPGESCSKKVMKEGGRCARHGQIWRRMKLEEKERNIQSGEEK
jgi:hypothetical protein